MNNNDYEDYMQVALNSENVQKLITNNIATEEDFLELDELSASFIASPGVFNLLFSRCITIQEFCECPQIYSSITDGNLFTEMQIRKLNDYAIQALGNKTILNYIKDNKINAEYYTRLESYTHRALASPCLQELIDSNVVTIQDILGLNELSATCIASSGVCKLLSEKATTLDEFLRYPKTFHSIIDNTPFSSEQHSSLSVEAIRALNNQFVLDYIRDGHISVEDYISLPDYTCEALSYKCVQKIIEENIITIDDIIDLEGIDAIYIVSSNVCRLLSGKYITFEEYMDCNFKCILGANGVFKYIKEGALSIPKINALVKENFEIVEELELYARKGSHEV